MVQSLASSLDLADFALVDTSRNLEAIIDKRFEWQIKAHRWYSLISRDGQIYAVADVKGERISLQRYVLTLENPEIAFAETKHVSFISKLGLDCRLTNLENRIGRQAVMRNRRPKRNTSSRYKGVFKSSGKSGDVRWRTQIKGEFGSMSIGTYDDEIWAATVYDAAASLLFDGSGYYNFPDSGPNFDALEIAATRIERFKNWKRRKAEQD
jgi:hypothetical protein